MKLNHRIGMIDWGIGGLGVYKELKKEVKNLSCIYLSDSGFTPYGQVNREKLIRRLHRLTKFFREQNIFTIVIACNAASTILKQIKKMNPDMNFFGMLQAGEVAIFKSKANSVLVLAGRRTIESRYFQKRFLRSKIKLQTLVAQPLSGLIEKGRQNTKEFSELIKGLTRQTSGEPEAILLACTHYPAALKIFKKHFHYAQILDPSVQLVQQIKKKILLSRGNSVSSRTQYFTTGSAALSKSSALKAFRIKIKTFKKVDIK